MDVSVLSKDSIKIKGRSSSFVIDPTAQIQEVGADAAVFLKDIENPEVGKVTDYRVIIKGAGNMKSPVQEFWEQNPMIIFILV